MMIVDLYDYMSGMPRSHVFLILSAGYMFYYLIEVVKRPFLAVKSGPFQSYLLKYVPTLEVKYWPTFWCFESRAQTVFASFIRSSMLPNVDYQREVLSLKDGGEVALDWLESGCADDAPVIIILPGLTGESQAEYIKCLISVANHRGIRCVVFNNRGLGGLTLKTPRLYCAANCEDISEVVNHVHRKHPNVKKGATGISMGGLILGNYLSNHAEEAKKILTSANIISVPWDVKKGCESIEKPYLNSMLNGHLASALCDTVKKYDILFKEEYEWKMDKVLASKTIKEFDSHFTSIHFGYGNVDNYYRDATLHNKLHNIQVPTLCLSAADDPFQPLDAIPIKAAEKSSHVAIVVTARGGHIGFLEGVWPGNKDQYMARIFGQYFEASLFDKDGEFAKTIEEVNATLVAE